MKIKVEHEVPYSECFAHSCKGDSDGGGWFEPCRYHTRQNRYLGKKKGLQRDAPKCTLFRRWLPGEYQKCDECIAAVERELEQK